MTIMEAIENGMIEFKKSDIEFPKLKSRLLMQFILNKSRQYIITNDRNELSEDEERKYFNAVSKIREGIPLEHITHQKEFMKLDLYVDNHVLIPRQDTEILVEEVIKIAKNINSKNILDLCTGSGAIAVSLAKYLPQCEITATDISNDALEIAKKNAIKNHVENQITFIGSDMFTNLTDKKFDIIVSNPPYIKKSVIEDLDEEVKKEPYIALNGGEDGLEFYRKIVKNASRFLKNKGYLCLEIGYDQKKDVIELIKKEEKYNSIYSKKDLCDNDRIVVAIMI